MLTLMGTAKIFLHIYLVLYPSVLVLEHNSLESLAVHRHSCATHARVLVSVAVTPQLKGKEGKGEICCYTGHSSRNKSDDTASEKIGNGESSRPR